MSPKFYLILALKLYTAYSFAGYGLLKLNSDPFMVSVFADIGLGQWFRYLTGAIELAGAILLFVPKLELPASLMLAATMIGAFLADLLILNAPLGLAIKLFTLSAILAIAHIDQLAFWRRKLGF